MTSFFISYTQADRAWAEWIAWVLEEAGHAATIQAWDFHAGDNFIEAMHRAAAEMDRTLAVLSPDYLKSAYTMAEWTAAFARDLAGDKGRLLPVRVREVDETGILAPIVYIDFVNLSEGAARERLLKGLVRDRGKPGERPPFPGTARPVFPGGLPSVPARLEELPLDYVPEPGILPAGSRMPFAANPMFVGRDKALNELARSLKVGETAVIGQIAAATGLGGIGKTQLACEFAHRYGRYFEGGVFWMSFADPTGVQAEVASCGQGLELHPEFDSLPLEKQVRLVQDAWYGSLPRLLVFDNCEDPKLLDQWRPKSGACRVLVTSRNSQWEPSLGVKALPLGVLTRLASMALLHKFRPDLSETDPMLAAIAKELGDLPLALHLAGSFLSRYKRAPFGKPESYLEQLRRGDLLHHPSLQGKGTEISPTGHEAHVARTFALSFEQLHLSDPVDVLAENLLVLATFFAPGEPIPRDLLLASLELNERDAAVFYDEVSDMALTAADAVERLLQLGLLESGENDRVVLHRLVAAFARNQETEQECRAAVERTLRGRAADINQAGYPAPLLTWQVHLRHVVDGAFEREDEGSGQLCMVLGFHLRMIGDFSGARHYDERALEVNGKVLGLEHPTTALSLNNLGSTLQDLGDLRGAREHHERALGIRKNVLGPGHPATAQSINNLGVVLQALGDFAQARECFEESLEIREQMLGLEHSDTAASLNNLGNVLRILGDLPGARQRFEQALQIREKVLSPEHPKLALSLNNLGGVLQTLGDLEGARAYGERALKIWEKALGSEHPNTRLARKNLATLGSEAEERRESAADPTLTAE